MLASVRAFLSGILDYAGLFPPAKLELDPAIRAFATHRSGPLGFAVPRFVCPALRLPDLAPYRDSVLAQGAPFHFAVLGSAAPDGAGLRDAVANDLARTQAFVERHAGRVAIDAIEVRLPDDLAESANEDVLAKTLAWYAESFAENLPRPPAVFFEAALARSWPERTTILARALAEASSESRVSCGLKLRTGGLEAAAFPPVQRIVHTLDACRTAHVPFKATAGLHHPLRRDDLDIGATMHGFLNVFGAGVLMHVGQLDRAHAEEMLEERDPAAFTFTDDDFAWRGARASTGEIERARALLVTSFGSCSVDEPREDLSALGLL